MVEMDVLRRISAPINLVLIGLGGVALAALAIMMVFITSPLKLGALGVTVWFVLLLGAITGCGTVTLYAGKRYLQLHGNPSSRLRYSLRQAMLLAMVAVCLLGLNSLGELSWRDGVLLGLFAILIELYARLRWP